MIILLWNIAKTCPYNTVTAISWLFLFRLYFNIDNVIKLYDITVYYISVS